MTFAPQCKTIADLHRKWADVLDMCEAAGFGMQWQCVSYRGISGLQRDFDDDPTQYEFALAIVEGRPVFRDSKLFDANGNELSVISSEVVQNFNYEYSLRTLAPGWPDDAPTPIRELSWNPPQRTIEINGVKVKAPGAIAATIDSTYSYPHGVTLRFANMDDAEAFKAALEGKK